MPFFAGVEEADITGALFVFFYAIQTLVFMIPLAALIILKKNVDWEDFGFVKISIKSILKYAALGYVIYFAVMLTVMTISMRFNVELPGFAQQESHIPLLGGEALVAGVTVLIMVLVAPLIEEILFRGFVFKTMSERWPAWIAFVVSATIFAGLHFEFASFMPLFILGMVMNWMFYKTKSIYPGLVFHIINNVLALGLEYYAFTSFEVLAM